MIWLLTSVGWTVLWLVTLGLGGWQAVRGRPLAGAAMAAAALCGLVLLGVPSLIDLVLPLVADIIGWPIAIAARRLLLGLGNALVVALLIAGVAVQRPTTG